MLERSSFRFQTTYEINICCLEFFHVMDVKLETVLSSVVGNAVLESKAIQIPFLPD